eukprot:Gb_08276 [translate_table: standard]
MDTWCYVTVSGINCHLSSVWLSGHNCVGSFLLVVKSGLQTAYTIVSFPQHSKGRPNNFIGSRLADVVIKLPEKTENCVLFIEIWCNWKSYLRLAKEGLDDFIGLARIPLTRNCSEKGKDMLGLVAANGIFSVWHPSHDGANSNVHVNVILGSEAHILQIQLKNRAATVIQRYIGSHSPTISKSKYGADYENIRKKSAMQTNPIQARSGGDGLITIFFIPDRGASTLDARGWTNADTERGKQMTSTAVRTINNQTTEEIIRQALDGFDSMNDS